MGGALFVALVRVLQTGVIVVGLFFDLALPLLP
jgi:hypothetical protein